MTLKSRIKEMLKDRVEKGLHAHGYRMIKLARQYGIDAVADVTRLAKLWNIDIALVFDVGANRGSSSLAFRAAWPACEVIAFEPNERVAQELSTNVEIVGRVSVEQIALGASGGQSDFFVYEDASVLSSLHAKTAFAERFGHKSKAVNVTVRTLDEFCEDRAIERINLLKIDAEGADHDVLIGAQRMLENDCIDFIYCEFNSLGDDASQLGSLLPIAQLLNAHAYNFIASYNDYILTDGRFFSVSNALFAADRGKS